MEVVHTGLRNPKEIAFDQFGTGITVDNNSDQGDRARVVFMLEGADSGWRMGHQVLHSFHETAGIPNRPINQWMEEKMWEPKNDSQPGHIVPPMLNSDLRSVRPRVLTLGQDSASAARINS